MVSDVEMEKKVAAFLEKLPYPHFQALHRIIGLLSRAAKFQYAKLYLVFNIFLLFGVSESR